MGVLNPTLVQAIRDLSKTGLSTRKIAARLGLNRSSVVAVVTGKTWKPKLTFTPLTIRNRVAVVHLTRGQHAIVDVEDWGRVVAAGRWHYRKKPEEYTGYAGTMIHRPGQKCRTLLLHCLLVDAPTGFVRDHINGNGLDNRRSNIRAVTNMVNTLNTKRTWGKSPYRGVVWECVVQRWQAKIKRGTLKRHLGTFHNQEDAARAYDRAAVELFGIHASLNFPNEWRGQCA